MILKNISILGLGVIPNKRRKNDEKNYERTVKHHNLKMRFCESVYTLALLAKNEQHHYSGIVLLNIKFIND